jgi:SAM-dependent methyltransferase
LLEQQNRIPKGKILDVASGYGRNALYMAAQGCSVVGIDRDAQVLNSLEVIAKQRQFLNLTVQQMDLEVEPAHAPDLGKNEYDGILVFFYLFRPLLPSILRALKPGGILLYETFLIDNHTLHHHPRRREFCLGHNELLSLTQGLRVLHYDEGEHEGPDRRDSAFTARLVAMKDAEG